MKQFRVTYRPWHSRGETKEVIATAKEYATEHNPSDLWYATAPGAGCSKNYPTPERAVGELIEADLGVVVKIEAIDG